MQESVKLKRALSLPLITFYGLGTIIGAGIYVLIGKVAGVAGLQTHWAFLCSSIIAAFTAFSYAELSSRFPKSAGDAVYIHEAWQKNWLSAFAGWAIALTGIVSAATIANGFVGYLQLFIDIPATVAILGLLVALGLIASWDIKASAVMITLITLIEVGGLLLVLSAAYRGEAILEWDALLQFPTLESFSGIALGAFLAFYAFIGFEDMVNVAEEVKNPKRNLPIAILLAIGCATLLYTSVAMVALRMMPVEELANSAAPMADLVSDSGISPKLIAAISLFAIINGALVQIIMASRILYGMANHKLAPKIFGRVSAKTQTPVIGTAVVTLVVMAFALWLPLVSLAKITSFLMLSVFTIVNVALVVIKRKQPNPENTITFSKVFPILGAITCLSLVAYQLLNAVSMH